jgi:DNA-binding XRE family transcriptional regulator
MLATGSGAVYHRLRASMHPDAFKRYDGNAFPLALVNESGAKGAIELKPPHVDGLAILPPDELEALAGEMLRHASELSQLEADTLDALCHTWMQQATHPQARAVIDVDALLALRGLKPKKSGSGRRGGYMPEQRREMLQALTRIQNLWLRIDELTTYTDNGSPSKKKQRETRRGVTGPAFILTGAGGQVRLDGGLDVDRVSFTPGDVLALYLWGPGRQTALLSARALRYDPYRQAPEKALTRYLSYLWRVRATRGTYREPLRVSTLLENCRLTRDARKPILTLRRLEKVLDTLQRDGLVAAWRYDSWQLGDAPPRGWAEVWSQELVIIEPPASTPEHYARELRGGIPMLADARPLPGRLKETRARLRLAQEGAAEACGLSQQAYSRAERGKGVSAENRKKLEAWLMTHVLPAS